MKALVLFSGGIDSTTCLGIAIDRYGKENVTALSILYGQKHTKEIESAKAVADYYGVELISLDLSEMFRYSDCSLLSHSDKAIPKESYAQQIKKTGGTPVSTYVPFRNGLFLCSAASIAGNAYPDCSAVFNEAMNTAIFEGSGHQLKIEAPFVNFTKADVVKKGLELKVPYELTWSCYEGGDKPCGICGTCIDRKAAFEKNGIKDPAERNGYQREK